MWAQLPAWQQSQQSPASTKPDRNPSNDMLRTAEPAIVLQEGYLAVAQEVQVACCTLHNQLLLYFLKTSQSPQPTRLPNTAAYCTLSLWDTRQGTP
jgi:hypothetical protein